MTPSRLKEILNYDSSTGVITNRKTKRVLIGDYDGLVTISCDRTKKTFKLKLERIAYALAFSITPRKDFKVLHKNLNTLDNSSRNLCLVSRGVFLQVKEAHRNLTCSIRISGHPVDQFDYVVHWIENNKEKQHKVSDIAKAKEIVLKLQLRYSKILTKYCVFD